MKVFLSYSREDASIAAAIASDLRQLDHDVWFDHELTGGQEWWQKILEEIRECDLFAFVISTASLESQACTQEWEYASALAKRILPFLGGDGVRTAVLPDALSKIQFVDYRTQDKHALLRLVKAIAGLPAAAQSPAPLPQPPAIPVSYLGRVAASIDAVEPLSPQEQSFLFLELDRGVDDPKTRDDALELLFRLRKRSDLLAHVGSRIDQALARHPRKESGRVASPLGAAVPSAQAESAPTASAPPMVTERSVAPALPMKLLVAESIAVDDTASIEALLRNAMATGDHWVIASGEDRVTIAKKENELVATVSFKRLGNKEDQVLQSNGWTLGGQFERMLGIGAISLAAAATGGLALGLFGTKGGRELLLRTVASRTLKSHQLLEGAMLIGQVFRTLSREDRMLTATNYGSTPPKSP